MVSEHREVERKYDAPLDVVLPALVALPGVEDVAPALEVEQVARYFDTADLRLLQARITLRRRVGGVDDGWHLKLPGLDGARLEVTAALGDVDEAVPAELFNRVRVHVRDREVAPQATLTTRRTIHRLLGRRGEVLGELCDDHVRAVAGQPAETATAGDGVEEWREWELELVHAPASFLDDVEPALLASGATASASPSKVARALAQKVPAGSWRRRAELPAEPPAGDLATGYLAQQLDRLQHQDVLLRGGEQEGVHQVRVAARRMRSALATYRHVWQPGATERLREDLRWVGQVLGEARDAQVARPRLLAMVEAQPAELVLGPVAARIDDELRATFRDARDRADVQLEGGRYFDLLDRLEAFVAAPPLSAAGSEPAADVVPELLRKNLRRVRAWHHAWEAAEKPEMRERALHEVRKAAKRLRYAGESAEPVLGARSAELAARAEAIQELLGEHQDTVVGRQLLRALGVRAHLAGENGFTFGRLHALEEARAAELTERYPELYDALPTKRLQAWLKG